MRIRSRTGLLFGLWPARLTNAFGVQYFLAHYQASHALEEMAALDSSSTLLNETSRSSASATASPGQFSNVSKKHRVPYLSKSSDAPPSFGGAASEDSLVELSWCLNFTMLCVVYLFLRRGSWLALWTTLGGHISAEPRATRHWQSGSAQGRISKSEGRNLTVNLWRVLLTIFSCAAFLVQPSVAGAGPSALYNRLVGTTISVGGYTVGGVYVSYVIQPYVNGVQSGTYSVGTFNTFVSSGGVYTYAWYTNGDSSSCPGVRRQLRMYVACGSILTVSAVSEPVTCTYEIRLLLPEACGVNFTVGNEAASASSSLSLSPSMTNSRTQTQSRSSSSSGTRTQNPTLSQTASITQTCTETATPTPSQSRTKSQSTSRTPSVTQTPTMTRSMTESASSTLTPTVTQSGSLTLTRSATASASLTLSGTRTQSRTASVSSSLTVSQSRSASRSASPSPSGTPSVTCTRSSSQSRSQVATSSPTPTPSGTATPSYTQTLTATSSLTQTKSMTSSLTRSSSTTASLTGTRSASSSHTQAPSPSSSATRSRSQVPSRSDSMSGTSSRSSSPSQTVTSGLTPSVTASQAATPTQSATASQSTSSSSSRSGSPSSTVSPSLSTSSSQSGTGSTSASSSASESGTPSVSTTQESTASGSGTPSETITRSGSASQTTSQGRTLSGTQSRTQTRSRGVSVSATGTSSCSASTSASQTVTASSSDTPSQSQSMTDTQTKSCSESPSPSDSKSTSASLSSSQSATCSPTQTATPSQSRSALPDDTPVFDNSDGRTRHLAPPTIRRRRELFDVSTTPGYVSVVARAAYGVSFHIIEGNPACGPGVYQLRTFTVAIGGVVEVDVKLSLWRTHVGDSLHSPGPATLVAVTAGVLLAGGMPTYAGIVLPAAFKVNTSADGPDATYIVVFEVSLDLQWHYALAPDSSGTTVTPDIPVGVFGAAVSSLWAPAQNGGNATESAAMRGLWNDVGSFPGVRLGAVKLICAPSSSGTSSGSGSMSQSSSQSSSQPSSATNSRSTTGSRSPSITATITGSRTNSMTSTCTGSRSRSKSQSTTRSGYSTQTSTYSPSKVQTHSASPSTSGSSSATGSSDDSLGQIFTPAPPPATGHASPASMPSQTQLATSSVSGSSSVAAQRPPSLMPSQSRAVEALTLAGDTGTGTTELELSVGLVALIIAISVITACCVAVILGILLRRHKKRHRCGDSLFPPLQVVTAFRAGTPCADVIVVHSPESSHIRANTPTDVPSFPHIPHVSVVSPMQEQLQQHNLVHQEQQRYRRAFLAPLPDAQVHSVLPAALPRAQPVGGVKVINPTMDEAEEEVAKLQQLRSQLLQAQQMATLGPVDAVSAHSPLRWAYAASDNDGAAARVQNVERAAGLGDNGILPPLTSVPPLSWQRRSPSLGILRTVRRICVPVHGSGLSCSELPPATSHSDHELAAESPATTESPATLSAPHSVPVETGGATSVVQQIAAGSDDGLHWCHWQQPLTDMQPQRPSHLPRLPIQTRPLRHERVINTLAWSGSGLSAPRVVFPSHGRLGAMLAVRIARRPLSIVRPPHSSGRLHRPGAAMQLHSYRNNASPISDASASESSSHPGLGFREHPDAAYPVPAERVAVDPRHWQPGVLDWLLEQA